MLSKQISLLSRGRKPARWRLLTLPWLLLGGAAAQAQTETASQDYRIADAYYALNDTAHAPAAFALMQREAAQKLPVAIGELGLFYVEGYGIAADPAHGIALLRQADQLGDDLAASNLAVLYATGQGVAEDKAEAMTLLRRPVTHRFVAGERTLGLILIGSSAPGERAEALTPLQDAAAQGDAGSSRELGWLYDNGFATAKNHSRAEGYFLAAAKAGDEPSIAAYGEDLATDGDPDGGPRDGEAVTWLAKAAQAGDAEAEEYYAYFLANGRGTKEDDAAAVTWCQRR
jgi:TPR repeat protein